MNHISSKNRVQGTGYRIKNSTVSTLHPEPCTLCHGFTLVETLVAITVLMIAIAGPLVVASKGLFGALASKDQMTAAYLAQESMETIKNLRDNNEYDIQSGIGTPWDGFANGSLQFRTSCTSTGLCDASAVDTSDTIAQCPTGGCPIYLESNGYGHDGNNGQPTLFTRYFYTTIVSQYEDNITVVVDWHEGTTPYEVSLSSELTNSTR